MSLSSYGNKPEPESWVDRMTEEVARYLGPDYHRAAGQLLKAWGDSFHEDQRINSAFAELQEIYDRGEGKG
jgi:hypothetical protein